MPEQDLPEYVDHVFTQEDRQAQLSDLQLLCSRIADGFAAHDDLRAAELFPERADLASCLLAEGFTQADLNNLGGEFPDGAWWLNPKALDGNAPPEPWQAELASLHQRARSTAANLRAVATLHPH